MEVKAAWAALVILGFSLLAKDVKASANGFIRASNGHFVDEDCNDFAAAGLNTWQLVDVAAGRVKSKPVKTDKGGNSDVVQWTMATAKANHLTVLRTFAHGTDPGHALQTKPGVYNERYFQALDYILDEAAKVGVRLILTLMDNWSAVDSKSQYVSWSPKARGTTLHVITNGILGEAGEPDAFFTDPTCRQMFKDHMSVMANRRNTINGKVYKDDPTIFAWDLINEPRCDCFPDSIPAPPELVSCRPECAAKMQRWIEEMSAHLKSLDPNHMVTVGEEGFYGPGSVSEAVNPGSGWATITGQNFSANHAPKDIDFAAIHLWPDNWEIWDPEFLDQWIQQHVKDSAAMGKPLLVEEFGKQIHIDTAHKKATINSVRAPFYRRVYSTLIKSLENNEALRGVVFWQFGFDPYVSNTVFGECRHCQAIQISTGDSVFQNVISPAAQKAASITEAAGKVPKCSPVPQNKRAAVSVHPIEEPNPGRTSQADEASKGSGTALNAGQLKSGGRPSRRVSEGRQAKFDARGSKRRTRSRNSQE